MKHLQGINIVKNVQSEQKLWTYNELGNPTNGGSNGSQPFMISVWGYRPTVGTDLLRKKPKCIVRAVIRHALRTAIIFAKPTSSRSKVLGFNLIIRKEKLKQINNMCLQILFENLCCYQPRSVEN